MCEHWRLYQRFVPFIHLIKNESSILMFHYLLERVFSHGKRLDTVDGLVQILGAIVV